MPLLSKSWALVVPVKRLEAAKTRLSVAPALRAQIALAMAIDTVAACVATGALVVAVTDDELATHQLLALGATVVADEPDAGLNPALRHGAEAAQAAWPGVRVAAVSSDLPSLTGAALVEVLAAAETSPLAVVADAAGTGTTVLASAGVDAFTPAFGPQSLQRHVELGAVDLTAAAGAQVRRDVDVVDDLAAAWTLGCGAATTALLRAHPGLLPPALQ